MGNRSQSRDKMLQILLRFVLYPAMMLAKHQLDGLANAGKYILSTQLPYFFQQWLIPTPLFNSIILVYIYIYMYVCVYIYVTGPTKIDHVSTKNRQFLACLLYHNLITIYTTATTSSSLLQNLMGFLLQLMEMEQFIQNERYQRKYNSV